MANRTLRAPLPSSLPAFFARIGQDLIWAVVAVLFCVVEAGVKLTEIQPLRFSAKRAAGRGAARRHGRGAYAG